MKSNHNGPESAMSKNIYWPVFNSSIISELLKVLVEYLLYNLQSVSWYYFTKRQWRYEPRLVTRRTSEESYIYFIFRYLTTKSKIHFKVMCIYRKIKNQQNWLNDKNFTASFHELFNNPSYMFFMYVQTLIILQCINIYMWQYWYKIYFKNVTWQIRETEGLYHLTNQE